MRRLPSSCLLPRHCHACLSLILEPSIWVRSRFPTSPLENATKQSEHTAQHWEKDQGRKLWLSSSVWGGNPVNNSRARDARRGTPTPASYLLFWAAKSFQTAGAAVPALPLVTLVWMQCHRQGASCTDTVLCPV